MTWAVSAASAVGALAAAISAAVALFAWRHRARPMGRPFTALAVMLAAWSLTYGLQLGFTTLDAQLPWQRLTLGLSGFVPVLWLLFVLAYTRREAWLGGRHVRLLFAEPVAFLGLCLTNPLHGLVWTDAALAVTRLGPVPALAFGPGYAAHITVAYAMVAAGIGLLVVYGTQIAPTYQKQVILLVTAAMPPFLTHVAFTLGASPVSNLDLTPFVFAFSGVVLGLGLFRFELLQLAPIARNQSLQEVGDGLVVVNTAGEVVDLFGVATRVLDPTPHVGAPIGAVFPETELAALDGTELTANVDGRRRVYQFQVSALDAHHDQPVGTVLILRDITGLRESRQRLSVSNRVLRHNLRNDMTVVLGYASELESQLDGEAAADARRIRETVEGFLELTEKARQITQLRDVGEGHQTAIDAAARLREVVDEVRSTHPQAQFRVDAPAEAPIDVVDPQAFRLALENVLDNAVRHNDAAEPRVEVTMARADEGMRIAVTDNGPGIPDIEQQAIAAGVETSLEHSQGLGLWLTYWCVTLLGGELDIDTPAGGTTVAITVPWAQATPAQDSSVEDAAA